MLYFLGAVVFANIVLFSLARREDRYEQRYLELSQEICCISDRWEDAISAKKSPEYIRALEQEMMKLETERDSLKD
jgi:hypothetical protein